MRRRILLLAIILVLLGVLVYLKSLSDKPIIVSRIQPTQTSIYAGSVDLELINLLRATQTNGEISREQAIGLAELYCTSVNGSRNQTNPSNVEAYHLTEKEAEERLNVDQLSTATVMVWLVSMDGLWEHVGGPVAPNPETTPLIFRHCNVIINAETADLVVLTN
jgi:hypothetical protein